VREVKEDIPEAAQSLGLTVRAFEIRPAHGLEQLFTALNKQRPDGLYITSGAQMGANRRLFADFALKFRFPTTNPSRDFVDVGGFMYYGANLADSYRRVAWYVDKILKGANPAELPIEQPTKFELLINLKAAKQLGITIPPAMLARADKVIR
jgi:putative ABC transport system substrate-binding protein